MSGSGLALEAVALTVRYGGVVANDAIDLIVSPGEVVGLIGPNGAGKTSFIDAVTGFTPYEGTVRFGEDSLDGMAPHRRARAGLGRTWQSGELFADLTIAENASVAVRPPTLRSMLVDLVRPTRHDRDRSLEPLFSAVGLDAVLDQPPSSLSLGQQKLAGIARALAGNPSVLLLDEPAAGLDTAESQVLGDHLRSIAAGGRGLLLVDHDMDLVMEVCDRLYVLEFGSVIASGPPGAVRADQRVVAAYLGGSDSSTAGIAG